MWLPLPKDAFATAIGMTKPERLADTCVDQVFLYHISWLEHWRRQDNRLKLAYLTDAATKHFTITIKPELGTSLCRARLTLSIDMLH